MKIKDILLDTGLQKGHLLLDIGYYESGLFLSKGLEIIGESSQAYILDLKENAFHIRSQMDKTNVINLFFNQKDEKMNFPFKNNLINLAILNFSILNYKHINLIYFLSEIYRVLNFEKKLLLVINTLEDFRNQLNSFLQEADKINLVILKKGYFQQKMGVFYFLKRKQDNVKSL